MAGLNQKAKAQRRYAAFDALRGVAAIAVVVGHFDQVMGRPWPPYFFLAVDLFFLVSGFVLATAYDRRFADGLTAFQFMRIRAIRLWPLVLIGAGIGLLNQLDYASPMGPQLHSFVSFVFSCFALPSPPQPDPNLLFPLNTVFWTLFLEFWVANLAFGLFWKRLQGPWLWLLILAGAIGLLSAFQTYHDLALGWGWDNAAVGLARMVYSFFLGTALGRRFPNGVAGLRLPVWLVALDVLGVFFIPVGDRFAGLAALAYSLLVLPLLVVLAAGARARYPKPGGLLGDASYALYAIHYPLIVEFSVIVTPKMIDPAAHGPWRFGAVLIGFTTALTGLALGIDRFADRPFRRWLSKRLITPNPISP